MVKQGFRGGKVVPMPNATKADLHRDSVRTILQPNELVVPLKYVDVVEEYLRKQGIRFGNFNRK